jgi:hypothetical protein
MMTTTTCQQQNFTKVPRNAPGAITLVPRIAPKFVVAHHMVGNTFPYKVADWLQDTHSAGIDGFALNIGPDDWMPACVADAYVYVHQSYFIHSLTHPTTQLRSRKAVWN